MPVWVDHTKRFFYLVFILAIISTYFLVKPYLSVIVLAIITVLLFQPVYKLWHKTFKGRDSIATPFSILTVLLTFLLPVATLVVITVNQAVDFYRQVNSVISTENVSLEILIEEANDFINTFPYGSYELTEENLAENIKNVIEPVGGYIIEKAPSILTLSTELITQLIVYITILAALFPAKDRIIEKIEYASPLDDDVDEIYIKRMVAMVKSMAKGTFIISIVQSVVAVIFLYFAGVDYLAFWFILMVFFGIIPLGVAFVTYPFSLVLILIGNTTEGISLLLLTTLVINNIDNILRPKLVSGDAQLHPALVILSVLGGLKMFGPMGFIYGPVLMIFFVTTFETYLKYYRIK